MSRNTRSRFALSGELVALTPLHVGGLAKRIDADLTLAVDGRGRFYLPGTSLAGALRHWCRTMFEARIVDEIWGHGPVGDNEDGLASRIQVEDGVLTGTAQVELRNGVGIDRFFGRAADGIKFEREVLPRGCRFDFRLSCDCSDAGNELQAKDMLLALLQAMESAEIRLGAAQTRGLGKVTLQNGKLRRWQLSAKSELLAGLKCERADCRGNVVGVDRGNGNQPAQLHSKIEIKWRPDGPLMVKADGATNDIDMYPLCSNTKEGMRLVLPGSSIKGALRAHGERILATVLNTVLNKEAPNGAADNPGQRFLQQMDRFELIKILFGAANSNRDNKQADTPALGRGALMIDDCYAKAPLDEFDNLLAGTPPAGVSGECALEPVTHNAIDRWTGGAADGALYTVLEPWNIEWESICIAIDHTRLKARASQSEEAEYDPSQAALALLYLIIQDLSNGKIPLGFGTNRGLGALIVREVSENWAEEPDVGKLQAAWSDYIRHYLNDPPQPARELQQ